MTYEKMIRNAANLIKEYAEDNHLSVEDKLIFESDMIQGYCKAIDDMYPEMIRKRAVAVDTAHFYLLDGYEFTFECED